MLKAKKSSRSEDGAVTRGINVHARFESCDGAHVIAHEALECSLGRGRMSSYGYCRFL